MGYLLQSLQVTRIRNGSPGKDAVVYDITVTPGAWMIGSDGKVSGDIAKLGSYPEIRVYKTVGPTRTDVTGCWKSSITTLPSEYKLKVVADGADVTSKLVTASGKYTLNPNGAAGGKAYKSVTVEFYINVPTVTMAGQNADGDLAASFSVAISQEGSAGMPGPMRPPLRMLDWDKCYAGFKFYSGDSEEDPSYDIVWQIVTAGGKDTVVWYQCIRNGTKTNQATPTDLLDTQGQPCFRTASAYHIVSTDVLLAQEAVIKNLIAQKVIACADPTNPQGQRIEIQPDTKAMYIYDADGKRRATFSGMKYDLDALLNSVSSSSWVKVGNNDTVTRSSSYADEDSGWVTARTINVTSDGGSSAVVVKLSASAAPVAEKKSTSLNEPGHIMSAHVVAEARIVNADDDEEEFDSAAIRVSSPPQGTANSVKDEDMSLFAVFPSGRNINAKLPRENNV